MTSAIKVKPEMRDKMWKHRVCGSGSQTRTGRAKLGCVASAASHLARLITAVLHDKRKMERY